MLIAVALTGPAPASAQDSSKEPAAPSFAPVAKTTKRAVTGGGDRVVIALRRTGPPGRPRPVAPRLVLQGEHHAAVEVIAGRAVSYQRGTGGQHEIAIELGHGLEPDHWTGALIFRVAGADPVTAGIDLDMRSGPELPLVVLAASVVAGAVLTWLLAQRPKARFARNAEQLRVVIAQRPETERAVLEPLWKDTWDTRGSNFDKARAQLDAITEGAEALREARDVQNRALSVHGAMGLTPWVQRLTGATRNVVTAVQSYAADYGDIRRRQATAADQLDEAVKAQTRLEALRPRAGAGAGQQHEFEAFEAAAERLKNELTHVSPDPEQNAPELGPLLTDVEGAFDALDESAGGLPEPPARPRSAGLRDVAAVAANALGWPVASGAAPVPSGAAGFDVAALIGGRLWPLAATALAAILLIVGFNTTYLGNATFGAEPSDWVALVVWGLAAWAARQALTGLGPPAESKRGE